MKIIVDMNLSPRWVATLSGSGFEALHWSNIGLADAEDMAIMAYAKVNEFVVLRNDLDFGAILAKSRGNKPSVVQLRAADVRPEAIGKRVVAALAILAGRLHDGAIVTIDQNRMRLSFLPLR